MQECEQVGTEWLIQQSKELKEFGVPVLHYYTLGKPKVIWNVVKELVVNHHFDEERGEIS